MGEKKAIARRTKQSDAKQGKENKGAGTRSTAKPIASSGQTHQSLDEMEQHAMEHTSHVISAIENAIAIWDATKEKTEDMEQRIIRLKRAYDLLTVWEKKALKMKISTRSTTERIKNLQEFTKICNSLAPTKPAGS
jgi:predicted kinase